MSPYGHLGNGCTDLILLQKCSTMAHAKWLMKQRWGPSQVRKKEREGERVRGKGGRGRERVREREHLIDLTDTPQAQFDHPHVHIRRVREFRFREVLKAAIDRGSRASSAGQEREDLSSSVDNLVEVSSIYYLLRILYMCWG